MTTVPYGKKDAAIGAIADLYAEAGNPHSAMIEIADRCNEVCVHCYQVQGQKGEMSTAEVQSVMDQLSAMGVLFLVISGGEPTLRKDFLELVTYARKLKFAVKIYSNGLNVTEELASELGRLAVQEVQMSLYSHRPDKHDWVTKVPGSFERTVAAAEFLRDAGVAVVLKTPAMAVNAGEHRQWVDFVTGLGVDYAMDPHLHGREGGSRDPESLRIAGDTLSALKKEPLLNRVPLNRSNLVPRSLESRPCSACSDYVHVEPNGEMRPCTQMTIGVGHALEDGVEASYRANREGLFIRKLAWGDMHGCRDCDLRSFCARCFADARREGGDAVGPYPSACAEAQGRYELLEDREIEIVPAEDGRDPALGPYKETRAGVFERIPDRLTEQDRRNREDHPWLVGDSAEAPPPAVPGGLVQIRRPGKKIREERVPE